MMWILGYETPRGINTQARGHRDITSHSLVLCFLLNPSICFSVKGHRLDPTVDIELVAYVLDRDQVCRLPVRWKG